MRIANRMRRPQGKALIGVLLFVAGIAVGAGGLLGLRALGFDPTAKILPPPDKKATDPVEEDDPLMTKELEVRRLLSDAKKMRERLEKDEAEVAVEKGRLAQQRTALEDLRREIHATSKKLKAEITALRIEKDAAELKNTKRLARIWAAMEPEQVYLIAKELDEAFVSQILYNMSERQAAPIIAGFAVSGPEGAKLASSVTSKLQELRLTARDAPKKATN